MKRTFEKIEEVKPMKGYEGNYDDLGINKFSNIQLRLKEGKLSKANQTKSSPSTFWTRKKS